MEEERAWNPIIVVADGVGEIFDPELLQQRLQARDGAGRHRVDEPGIGSSPLAQYVTNDTAPLI